jgi:hypothetical protein
MINSQQSFEGKYNGHMDNDDIHLQLNEDKKNEYSGKMTDSQQNYVVKAKSNGNNLTGTATETQLGLVFKISGGWQDLKLKLKLEIEGLPDNMEILFEKESQSPDPKQNKPEKKNNQITEFKFPKDATHDPMLIGAWTKNENYNSGFGDNYMGASYSETLVLFENGTVGDGGSQATMSGNNYLGQSESGFKALPGVFWYNINNQLYISAIQDGKTETQHLGKYYIENNNMLITSTNGNKTLLSRK